MDQSLKKWQAPTYPLSCLFCCRGIKTNLVLLSWNTDNLTTAVQAAKCYQFPTLDSSFGLLLRCWIMLWSSQLFTSDCGTCMANWQRHAAVLALCSRVQSLLMAPVFFYRWLLEWVHSCLAIWGPKLVSPQLYVVVVSQSTDMIICHIIYSKTQLLLSSTEASPWRPHWWWFPVIFLI